MTRPDDLDPVGQASLDTSLASTQDLAARTEHLRALARLMTGRRDRQLERQMTAAADGGEPALISNTTGLPSDQGAVTAGLTLRRNLGSAEGHVNPITMLNRQTYGRANPDLLRRRVLLADQPHRNSARAIFSGR